MKVAVDSIWASPSVLHLRVLVWVGQDNYQMKFWTTVPLGEIEPEAVKALRDLVIDEVDRDEDLQQVLWE